MLIVLCSSCKESTEDEKSDATDGGTFISEYASQFSFEQSEKIDKDWYEIEAQGGTVRIRGNNANSMAVGLNYYLNHYCLYLCFLVCERYGGDAGSITHATGKNNFDCPLQEPILS